jgi:hypothetical protein
MWREPKIGKSGSAWHIAHTKKNSWCAGASKLFVGPALRFIFQCRNLFLFNGYFYATTAYINVALIHCFYLSNISMQNILCGCWNLAARFTFEQKIVSNAHWRVWCAGRCVGASYFLLCACASFTWPWEAEIFYLSFSLKRHWNVWEVGLKWGSAAPPGGFSAVASTIKSAPVGFFYLAVRQRRLRTELGEFGYQHHINSTFGVVGHGSSA